MRDYVDAFRALRATPVVSVVAALSLAMGLLSLVGVLGAFVPAWRAVRVDPLPSLRSS
jgi:ABC-type antimicrobial peptide transport system permease subunit